MSKVHKISQKTYFKNRKQLHDLYKLGKKFDKEKDPMKRAIMEKELIAKCAVMKGKLNLQDASEEDIKNAMNTSDVIPENNVTDSCQTENTEN